MFIESVKPNSYNISSTVDDNGNTTKNVWSITIQLLVALIIDLYFRMHFLQAIVHVFVFYILCRTMTNFSLMQSNRIRFQRYKCCNAITLRREQRYTDKGIKYFFRFYCYFESFFLIKEIRHRIGKEQFAPRRHGFKKL